MMDFDLAIVTSIAALVGVIVTPFVAKFALFDPFRADLNELRKFQAEDKVKIDLFWSVIQSRVASLVKAPTHDRLDDLVEKFEQHIATLPELRELQEELASRAAEEGLKPIQEDAITLVLLYLADRIAAKHTAEVTGKPNRTIRQPPDTRSQIQKRAHQVELEAAQVEANERQPPTLAALAEFLTQPDIHAELTHDAHQAVQRLADEDPAKK